MEISAAKQQKIDAMIMAERRGILPESKKPLLQALRDRGIVEADPFQQADTSPVYFDERKERAKVTTVGGPNVPANVNVERLAERRARAESGQLESNLEPFSNLKLGLAANPQREIQRVVADQFGADVPVRYDRNTSKYQYIDPETNRVVNIDKGDLDFSDIARGAGEIPVVAGDVAGTVAGGVAGAASPVPGGAIIGEAVGSGVGTYLGELTRLYTGKAFGVNESLSFEDMHDLALKRALLSAGVTGVAGITMQTGKAAINFLKGRTGTKDAALRAGLNEEEAKEIVDQVNQMQRQFGPLPKEGEVKFTAAKRSGDEKLLSDENIVRRQQEHVKKFSDRDAADEKGLATAFDAITPSRAGGDTGATHFQHVRNQRINKATDALEASKQNLQSQLDELNAPEIDGSGDVVRKAIEEKRIVVKDYLDRIHSQWKRLAGVKESGTESSVKIELGANVRKELKALDKESRNAIATAVKTARAGVVTDKFKKSAGGKTVDTGLVDKSGRPITRLSTSKATDLVDYQTTISALRTLLRDGDKGQSSLNGEQLKVVSRVLRSLVRNRDTYLSKSGNDDILFAIREADIATSEAKTMLDRSIAGEIMRKREGRYVTRSQDVFDKGFVKGGREQSQELKKVIGGNEEAMRAWRGDIRAKYQNEVVGEDGPTLKKHIKFMKDYGEAMEPFFTKEEMARVKRLGGLVKVVEDQEKKHANILRMLNAPQGKVGKMQKHLPSLDPEQVAPWLVGDAKTGPGRVRRYLALTKSNPRAAEEARNEVRQLFRRDVYSEGRLDHNRFASHIKRNEATYRELFGDKYVDNLFTINKALDISDRAGRTLAEKELLGVGTQVARGMAFPPLSKEGKLFTAALMFRTKTGRNAIARALLNPEDLNELAALSELSTSSREAVELMSSLGMIAATSEELEQ